MKIVGICMIRSDVDTVGPFVRDALRVLDHPSSRGSVLQSKRRLRRCRRTRSAMRTSRATAPIALLRPRPGHLDGHAHDETAADIPPGKPGTDGRQRA